MSYKVNNEVLDSAIKGLSEKEIRQVYMRLIGALSVLVDEKTWATAVDTAAVSGYWLGGDVLKRAIKAAEVSS